MTSDVVVFGGTARIEGRVEGDVVSIGGSVELGPGAHVTGDVAVVGGALHRDPGAIVDGDVSEVGIGQAVLGGVERSREAAGWVSPFTPLRRFLDYAGLATTTARTLALMLLACVLLLVAPRMVERIGDRAFAEPVKAGLVGFLLELIFVPVLVASILLLVITIVGIPLLALLPVALLAVVIVLLAGFTAVARRVGEAVAGRFGWQAPGPYPGDRDRHCHRAGAAAAGADAGCRVRPPGTRDRAADSDRRLRGVLRVDDRSGSGDAGPVQAESQPRTGAGARHRSARLTRVSNHLRRSPSASSRTAPRPRGRAAFTVPP